MIIPTPPEPIIMYKQLFLNLVCIPVGPDYQPPPSQIASYCWWDKLLRRRFLNTSLRKIILKKQKIEKRYPRKRMRHFWIISVRWNWPMVKTLAEWNILMKNLFACCINQTNKNQDLFSILKVTVSQKILLAQKIPLGPLINVAYVTNLTTCYER